MSENDVEDVFKLISKPQWKRYNNQATTKTRDIIFQYLPNKKHYKMTQFRYRKSPNNFVYYWANESKEYVPTKEVVARDIRLWEEV